MLFETQPLEISDSRRRELIRGIEKALFRLKNQQRIYAADHLNPHGHDDVAVAEFFIAERPHLPGGLFILQLAGNTF